MEILSRSFLYEWIISGSENKFQVPNNYFSFNCSNDDTKTCFRIFHFLIRDIEFFVSNAKNDDESTTYIKTLILSTLDNNRGQLQNIKNENIKKRFVKFFNSFSYLSKTKDNINKIYTNFNNKMSSIFSSIISLNFVDNERSKNNFLSFQHMNTIFLSYSFDDKLYSYALFCYFYYKKAFIFVDWMWYGKNDDAKDLKEKLESVIKKCNQFLFLRTSNSELLLKTGSTIKQWCAWEIGVFYEKNKNEKYLLDTMSIDSYYNKHNLIIDDLLRFNGINDRGLIIS